MRQATLALDQCEWDAKPTEGVNLATGEAFWGAAVKYRRIGTRRWYRLNLIDSHSWDTEAIHAAIEAHVRMNGTLR
jgi:hypothetical protein